MDITLTFGKHNGKKLSEVPREYVEWMAENISKPSIKQAAQAFLKEHSAPVNPTPKKEKVPGMSPRTYQEATKLGWMAERGYGNAKATLLAARDKDGFICVEDDNEFGEYACHLLLVVTDGGSVLDPHSNFTFMTYDQVEAVLKRYPQVDSDQFLVEAAENDREREDMKRRTITLKSQDGKHKIMLIIWSANTIDVSIDGIEQGEYRMRDLNEKEQRDPQWQVAAAVLEPDEDSPLCRPGSRNIGLTPERKALVEAKIQEISRKD